MRAATATLALTPALYAIVPAVARRFDVLGGVERNKPYRDDYVYVFSPWSVVEDSAEVVADSEPAAAVSETDPLGSDHCSRRQEVAC